MTLADSSNSVSSQKNSSAALQREDVCDRVIEARKVSRRFGQTLALDKVSLAVAPGESRALVGRNGAGKSTLVSIMTGLDAPTHGSVRFGGHPAPPITDRSAWRSQIACVYQHSKLVPSLTVAENLFLHRQPHKRGLVSWRTMRAAARRLLDDWAVTVGVDAVVGDLTVGERQMVEIARSLSIGTRIVVLDEPTAELESQAVQRLFAQIADLRERGISFIYISHYLDEIFDICQSVTVLRDGRLALEADLGDVAKSDVISAMVGDHETPARQPQRLGSNSDAEVIEIRGIKLGDTKSPINMTIRAGECVGLAGLAGSGKTTVAEIVAGLRPPPAGEVRVGGDLVPGNVADAIRRGVAYVPPDRHRQGYVPGLGIAENIALPVMGELGKWSWLSLRRRNAMAGTLAAELDIVGSSLEQPVGELSGGNQQKVVMARALSSKPRALVLVHPTSGVDIASKSALFAAVGRAQEAGTAVLLVSDEMDELAICDRITVIFDGEVVAHFDAGTPERELVAAIEGVDIHGN